MLRFVWFQMKGGGDKLDAFMNGDWKWTSKEGKKYPPPKEIKNKKNQAVA